MPPPCIDVELEKRACNSYSIFHLGNEISLRVARE
jgi:hypothetical protein